MGKGRTHSIMLRVRAIEVYFFRLPLVYVAYCIMSIRFSCLSQTFHKSIIMFLDLFAPSLVLTLVQLKWAQAFRVSLLCLWCFHNASPVLKESFG